MASSSPPTHPEGFLDPAVLARLENAHIRAKALAEGIIAGLHRSPHRGGSVEFAEYVEYTPGMEIRHVDWRVFGKSDKYYVKQFEDETNLRVYLLLDGSGSMDFCSEHAPLTKLRYMSFLAATFAYLFIRQGDAVGALSFDEAARTYLPASARKNHLEDLFYLLENLPGAGQTDLAAALRSVAERARPRSLIMLFSDMLYADEEVLQLMQVLRKRRYEVALFHVIDPAELDLPYEGLTLFDGLEDEGALLADPDDLRQAYREHMEQHLENIRRHCADGDIEYVRCLTSAPLEEPGIQFLRGRA